jgi:O-succinylbenzoic acid--CoA ligase
VTLRLVALDLPGGPAFVDELKRIWDRGDAAFPVDQRLPRAARLELMSTVGVGEEVDEGDALVVTTSGSTGAPKGVVLTHDAVAASAGATSARLGVTPDDHWLACLPLSHVGGLSVVTRARYAHARLTVLPGFDATAVTEVGATLVSLVPTALARVDPTIFRTIVLGGSRPPADRPSNTVTTYGMTETGSGVVYDGRPLDNVEVRLTDQSEILVRGPMLLRAYRDGTSPLDADGWLRTGDIGCWLDDGRLHVVGRAGDLIITGGENVWPEAVEQALLDHPSVSEVLVRGRPDQEWGQMVEAVVVADGDPPTLDALRDHIKEHHPAFMAPQRLEIVAQLPRSSLGKLRRA